MRKIAFVALVLMGAGRPVEHAEGPTARVTGRVTSRAHAPLPDARVTLKAVDRGTTASVTTDKAGRFTMDVVEGRYRLTVSCRGVEASSEQVLDIARGASLNIDFALDVPGAPAA